MVMDCLLVNACETGLRVMEIYIVPLKMVKRQVYNI